MIPSTETRFNPIALTDLTERTIELSFSSEYPVERAWGTEILSHQPNHIDLSRMKGAPFLWNHDPNQVIGVIENTYLDNKKARCIVRWSQEEEGQKYKRLVEDGILTNISTSYQINETQDLGKGKILVKRWTPLEVSLVSIPADPSVGIGRAMEINEQISEERARIRNIAALGQRYHLNELANRLIDQGKTLEESRSIFLDHITNQQAPIAQDIELGFSPQEERSYSIVRAINAAIDNNWSKAGLEKEASEAIAKRTGKSPKGFYVPTKDLKIQKRASYTVGTDSTGGYTVDTELLSQNFIDLLRNKSSVMRMGVTMMSGLQGNIAIPRQATAASTYWVAENGSITQSEATFDQIGMSPKTIAARSQFSRLMLLQSTLDIEQFIRNDFAQIMALGIDKAALMGSGNNNEPLGILNTPNINTVAMGTNGGAPTRAAIIDLIKQIQIDNADVDGMKFLTNPQVAAKLMLTPIQTGGVEGNFILKEGGASLCGYSLFTSNQVPSNLTKGTGTNLSALVFGNWRDLLIGEWGVLEILPNPYGAGYNSGAIDIRVMQTIDLTVRHVESFAAITDLITT